jgi:hypothetical protein
MLMRGVNTSIARIAILLSSFAVVNWRVSILGGIG